MPNHPLAEVFGFPITNHSDLANRYRDHRLCPFNNRVPNCTKDKANDPLGVCSIYDDHNATVTCAIDRGFYETLPSLKEVAKKDADIAWLVYDLKPNEQRQAFDLTPHKTVYTEFDSALNQITKAEAGAVEDFIHHLQEKLDARLEGNSPEAPILGDVILS